MPNEPGSLGRVVKMLAEAGINLEYAYASGIDRVPMVAVVLGVADAQRASAATGISRTRGREKANLIFENAKNPAPLKDVESSGNAPLY